MTELLPTLRLYADMADRKMNVAMLPLDIFELAIAALQDAQENLECRAVAIREYARREGELMAMLKSKEKAPNP